MFIIQGRIFCEVVILYNQRLKLDFETPNFCGAFFIIVVFVLIGVTFYLFNKKPHKIGSKMLFLSVLLSGIFTEYLLVLTYSRGAFIAFVLTAMMFIYAVKDKKERLVILFFLAIFFIFLAIVPFGMSRAGSIFSDDDSIGNRLILWKSAIGITYDNWLLGTGFSKFGDTFIAWYQPLNMLQEYTTPVNNCLTISAGGGIFLFFLFMFLSCISTIGLIIENKIKRNPIVYSFAFAQIGYFICGFSSTLFASPCLNIVIVILTTLSLGYIGRISIKERANLERVFKTLKYPMIVSLMSCIILLMIGFWLKEYSSTKYFIYKNIGVNKINVYRIAPTKSKVKAVIIYSYDNKNNIITREARSTIRFLAEKGYVVVTPQFTDIDIRAPKELEETIEFVERKKEMNCLPVILVGQSEGGQYSIIAAASHEGTRIKAVASIGAPAKWPFIELSTKEYISKIKQPILLLHGGNDKKYELENLNILVKAAKMGISKSIIYKDADTYLRPKRKEALEEIDKFITKVIE